MDYSVLKKLYNWTKESFLKDLISLYKEKNNVVVNYLYFANATKHKLFENQENNLQISFKKALLKSDFILTDGIALQVFYYFVSILNKDISRAWLENLNGTDLSPYIFQELPKFWTVSVYIYNVYDPNIWKTQEWIDLSLEKIKQKFPNSNFVWAYNSLYSERWKNFPFDDLKQSLEKDVSDFKLFFNCTWTPFQEIWTYENIEFFEENSFIVLNSGWAIDFISWFEKRAPKILVKLRVFETFWRIITNPKKNLPKFLSMFWIFRLLLKMMLKK